MNKSNSSKSTGNSGQMEQQRYDSASISFRDLMNSWTERDDRHLPGAAAAGYHSSLRNHGNGNGNGNGSDRQEGYERAMDRLNLFASPTVVQKQLRSTSSSHHDGPPIQPDAIAIPMVTPNEAITPVTSSDLQKLCLESPSSKEILGRIPGPNIFASESSSSSTINNIRDEPADTNRVADRVRTSLDLSGDGAALNLRFPKRSRATGTRSSQLDTFSPVPTRGDSSSSWLSPRQAATARPPAVPETPTQSKSTQSNKEADRKTSYQQRKDRDQMVLDEISRMIREVEEKEIDEKMDPNVVEVLQKAALESSAYTKRWYDAIHDNFLYCPSLASIILDFSLLEDAKSIYGKELPLLYTVSLRSIASYTVVQEEEIPEYVYRLAMAEGDQG